MLSKLRVGESLLLVENTLYGEIDRVQVAIDRIKAFEPMALANNPNGYYVCISGGKDSTVIQHLCIMAGVKCEFVHNHTSVDYPETVYFVRREKKRVEKLGYTFRIEHATGNDGNRLTMWNLIPKKGFPTRLMRWCCQKFKEYGGENRYTITGVRWAESVKRQNNRAVHETFAHKRDEKILLNNDNDMKRKLSEMCMTQHKFVLNPIIDWSDDDVWEFIKKYNLPYNPLYDMGHTRVGCVGCPMSTKQFQELELNLKYKQMYIHAGARYLDYRKSKGLEAYNANWDTPENYYLWWTEQVKKENKEIEGQCEFM
jgi:phosphoadenosine phosphosulfate reductase